MIHGSAFQFSFLGYAARFANPGALWLIAIVAGLAVVAAFGIARRRRALREAAGMLADRVAPGNGALLPSLRLSFMSAGLMLFAGALAQPQCGTRAELAKRYGIDLVVALDASRSMLARDVKPDRLTRAKLELSALIDRLKGDRVGVVVFAGEAFVQCPLTTDYSAAKLFLKAVDPNSVPQQGTAIGNALEASQEVLTAADRGAKGKAVLLITDGEDNDEGATEAAEALSTDGIRVFAIGVGSTTGEPIPVLDREGNVTGYKRDRSGNTVMTRLNETLLRDIAAKTEGRYVHSAAGDLGIGEVYEELDRMDKSEFESRLTMQYEDRYAYAAFPGFLLLLCGAVLRDGRWRREAAVVPPKDEGRRAA
jgi:Ca-activated chloride channel family protein